MRETMTNTLHERIKMLIQETNDAFSSCAGCMNTDYAAFASMRLTEFKKLLNNPGLTGNDLRRLLRKGDQNQRNADPEGCWATFIANYVTQNANQNLADSVHYGLDKIYEEKP